MLAIFEALSRSSQDGDLGLTVSGLARAVRRDKSSVSRQLKPLVDLGLVERDTTGLHRLGWKLFAVAAQAGDQRLLLLAPPVMRQLATVLGERVHLSIRRNEDVFTIVSEGVQQVIEANIWVGRAVPIWCTSSGRALLFDHTSDEIHALIEKTFSKGPGSQAPTSVDDVVARVEKARLQGHALVVDEFEDGLSGAAAPVRDVHGRIVAAINVSVPSFRIADNLTHVGRQVAQAATYLSRSLSSPPTRSKDNHNAQNGPNTDLRRIS